MPLTPQLLTQFFTDWAKINNIIIASSNVDLDDLISILKKFGVTTVEELAFIIPNNYVLTLLSQGIGTKKKPLTLVSHIYTLMVLKNLTLTHDIWSIDTKISRDFTKVFEAIMSPEEFDTFKKVYDANLYK